MLHYVTEDQDLLLRVMWIQILQETLIKGNLFWLYVYTCRRSCKLGFETADCCGFIYNRNRIHGSYISLQESYLDIKIIRGARAQTRENSCVL